MAQLTHTIVAGDSLSKIAKNYGVEMDDLMAANPQITDPGLIKTGQKLTIPLPEIAPPEERGTERNRQAAKVIFRGRMCIFGGPQDTGMGVDEGLALVTQRNLAHCKDYFLPSQPAGTTGLARRLNPETFYLACRWNYEETPKDVLVKSWVEVINPLNTKMALAKPVDWGPALWTGRAADLSPGLARHLGVETDDEVEVRFAPGAPITKGEVESAPPVKVSAPPEKPLNQAQLKRHFGDFYYDEDYSQPGAWIIIDRAWVAANITKVHIPCLEGVLTYNNARFGGWVQCHKKIAKPLQAVFAEILAAGLKNRLLFWSGSLAPRHINHDRSRPLSSHSWGVALDINHQWNGYNVDPPEKGQKGSVVELVPIFQKHGFFWGGDFNTPDGMHFEYARVPA